MDSEDPSPLNPLQVPFCNNLVNRLTQEHATLFPLASVPAHWHIGHHLPFGQHLSFGRYLACGCNLWSFALRAILRLRL